MADFADKNSQQRFYRPVPKELNNVFRTTEKFYRKPPTGTAAKKLRNNLKETDFSNVLDFANLNNNLDKNKDIIIDYSNNIQIMSELNVHVPIITKFYGIKNVPGFLFIPNPFQDEQQVFWANKCVKEYTLNNPTNVVNVEMIKWRDEQKNSYTKEEETKKEKSLFMTEWKEEKMNKVRWATVGYHFQWTKRIYQRDKKGIFPPELSILCKQLAHQVGYQMEPEAATLNYYSNPKYLMGGHVDDAEEALDKPIVSVSFGNTIVFLIGGVSREIEPIPLYIRSGDIVIMGGESRKFYHGVPRMLENTSPSFFDNTYTKNSRINVNCRQVFK